MFYSSQAFRFIAASVALLATANAALCGCSKDIALRITNIYENGDTDFHYGYCENIHDGRGFTTGIAGFCTGTGDAWELIQEYHKITGGNDDFSPMDRVLKKYAKNGSDSTSGLGNYCKVWEKLSKTDQRFKRLQDTMRDSMYFNPSQKLADKVGLKLDVSRGEMYDTGLEHGTGEGPDDLAALIKATSNSFKSDSSGDSGSTLTINGHHVDEIVWLKKFIAVRDNDLKHPKDPENQSGEWANDLYRTRSYTHMINARSYMFGTSVEALDNDGKRITVKCANSNRRRRRDVNGKFV